MKALSLRAINVVLALTMLLVPFAASVSAAPEPAPVSSTASNWAAAPQQNDVTGKIISVGDEPAESHSDERERRFAEAKDEREALRAEMHSQFRWTIGLLFPLVVGVIAMVIRVFFVGTF